MGIVRWGIIGCGDVTEVKSGPGFQKADGSQLVAVMRRNAQLAEDYARRHHVPRWYADADALINDSDVDAVYVATPPGSHKEYVIRCAAAGKPVFVEKPMGVNHAECLEMIEVCRAANVPLFVAYYRRTLPRFLKVKALIDEGAIGDVRTVSVRLHKSLQERDKDASSFWRVDPKTGGGGHFFDLAGHQLDYLDFVFGPVVEAMGISANQAGAYPAEDVVSGCFRFSSGVQGTGQWCFTVSESSDLIEILGSRGAIRFACFQDSPIEVARDGRTEMFPVANPPHVHQPLIQTIVDALNGRGTCPSDGVSGARTAWVMDRLVGR